MAVNIIGQYLTQLQSNFPPMSLPTSTSDATFPEPSTFQSSFPGESSFRKRRATTTSYDAQHEQEVIATLSNFHAARCEPASQPGPSGVTVIDDDVLLHQLQQACHNAIETIDGNLLALPIGGSDCMPVKVKSTYLAGHAVNCILDGGEIWICVPQILAVVLNGYDHHYIMSKMQSTKILTQGATQEQIIAFQKRGALPPTVNSCTLITKPCAEQLYGLIVDPPHYGYLQNVKCESILIQHQNFGGAEGRLIVALYPGPCVQCISCRRCMVPAAFVRHSHSQAFLTAINWGCETSAWKDLIRLHDSVEFDKDQQAQFDAFLQNLRDEVKQESNVVAPTTGGLEQLIAKKVAAALPTTSGVGGGGGVPSSAGQPMFPTQFGALAAQLIAHQHQQQQQQQQQNNHVAAESAVNNVPNFAAALAALPQTSQQPNILALAQQLQHQNFLAALAQQQQQQQQQQHHAPAPSVSGINVLNVLNHLRNQAAANATAQQPHVALEDGETPRKRANTVSDPTMRSMAVPVSASNRANDFPLTGISFGALAEDHELLRMLQQITTTENVSIITERINNAIVRRMQPIVADNAHLRGQLDEMRAELQGKTDLLSRLTAAAVSASAAQSAPETIEIDDDDNIVVDDVAPVSSR